LRWKASKKLFTVAVWLSGMRIVVVGSPNLPWPRDLPAFSRFLPQFDMFESLPLKFGAIFKHALYSAVKQSRAKAGIKLRIPGARLSMHSGKRF
jgi:hypothetical protein